MKMEKNDEIVQYYVVNKELKMTGPKMAAQVSHVAEDMAFKYQHENDYLQWRQESRTKIILGGKEKDLRKLIELGFDFIIDEGRTEIPKNSLTVVGLKPMWKSQAQKYIKRLRLYREE